MRDVVPGFRCVPMTERFRFEKMPIMPIGLALTIVIFSGCRLAGALGVLSVDLPAEDQVISGGDEVGGFGLLGEIREQDTLTDDSIAVERSLQDISQDEPVILEIATVLPFGGPPRLAEFAQLVAEGIEVAAVEMSGPLLNVRIISVDDQGDPTLTRDLVRELENSSIRAMVGFLEDTSLEIAGSARQIGLPLISPTARSASRAGEGIYSLEGPDPVAAAEMARYAFKSGYSRIAVLHSQSSESVQEADAFAEMSRTLGLPIVGRYAYQAGATFFGEEIIEAQNALRAAEIAALGLEENDTLHVELLEPVALFLPIPPEDVEFIAPQIVHYGLDTLAIDILGTSGWTAPQVLETVDLRHTTGVVATASVGRMEDRNTSIQFREAYERHFQRSLISGVPALGYDTTLLLIEALKGGSESPEEIRIAIEGLRDIEGAAGVYSLVDGRILRRTEVVYIDEGILLPVG